MKKYFLIILILGLLVSSCIFKFAKEAGSSDKEIFQANDSSLIKYQIPEWYKDAKIGYWVHWGLYSVPAYAGDHAAEWYGRWMYNVDDGSGREKCMSYERKGLKTAAFHVRKFGSPEKFQYADFIPMFKAENFDADKWADLFKNGGAKFFVMMAMHHDSFCLWDSKTQPFNSVNMGPHRDFVAEMKKAIKSRGMYFGVSNHSAWNGEFFQYRHNNGFDKKDTKKDIEFYGTGKIDSAAVARWRKRTYELADKYHPDLYYFDWGWNRKAYTKKDREEFLVHYYNGALKWNNAKFPAPNVAVNYKGWNNLPYGCAVLDLERGVMQEGREDLWQTDTSVGYHSWSYDPNEKYRSVDQCIDMLVDIVSKNGTLLLDIGPKADGTIPEQSAKIIKGIGRWLDVNGEAIYATRPWIVYGEGPGKPKSGFNGDLVKYSSKDIRFTRSKDDKFLYVIMLGWPEKKIFIKSLNKSNIDMSSVKNIELLGSRGKVVYTQSDDGLEVSLPSKPLGVENAFVIKIER